VTEKHPLDEIMPFLVVGGGGLLLYAVWLYDALKKGGDRAFYKALRSGAYDSALGWHNAILAEGRLTIETDQLIMTFKEVRTFREIENTRHYVYLYLRNGGAIIIPKADVRGGDAVTFAGAVRRMGRDDKPPEAETGIRAV
jgi:hypothetical protein